ncbi:MAG: hypothetical protein HY578_08350, partial [Nitrospinae bacterium]|nr:hypothetical protein [Nitrospinota bacterium]
MSNQRINELFQRVAEFQEQLNQIDGEFREVEGISDERAYSSQFHHPYD